MGNIGEDIVDDVPAVGTSGTAFASTINDILEEVIERLEAEVPVSSIAPADAALDMNAQAVQNASYLGMYAQDSTPSGAPYGRFVYYNNEVYIVVPSGTIQLTANGAVNVSSVGGITGDYGGADPAAVNFVGSQERYDFWDDFSASEYALVRARGFDVVDDPGGGIASIRAHASSASYNFILPADDPASGVSVLTINSSGQLQLGESATVTNAFTGTFKHGDESIWTPARAVASTNVSGTAFQSSGGKLELSAAGGASAVVDFYIPSPPVGRRLKSVSVRSFLSGTGTTTTQVDIYEADGNATYSSVATGSSTTGGSTITVTANNTDSVTATRYYKVRVSFTATSLITGEIYALGTTWDYV